MGWEAHATAAGWMGANRGELTPCREVNYTSDGDANMPDFVVKGAIGLMKLRKL